jgi:hypothetical protein
VVSLAKLKLNFSKTDICCPLFYPKDWKEKDKKHVEWTKAWIATLSELQAYVKKVHTTGIVWNPKGGDAKAMAGCNGKRVNVRKYETGLVLGFPPDLLWYWVLFSIRRAPVIYCVASCDRCLSSPQLAVSASVVDNNYASL